ncbi:TraR/DksA C4-type zinc finger protein [Serratia sp. NPDC078593]|uniref:TraR/DksA C4-type zinc finger protein n=1 Tax=unclassified Serratia (in: enterobacteria) TaxID=2647522 RepID=UPI0037D14594
MAGLIDIAQEYQAAILAEKIALAGLAVRIPPTLHCEVCNEIIPAARRITVPCLRYCTDCQQYKEERIRYFVPD